MQGCNFLQMKKIIWVSIFWLACFGASAQQLGNLQRTGQDVDANVDGDTRSTKRVDVDALVSEYKIISIENDTVEVDTSLTLQKLYRYNYLRKDYFELLPLSNTGQAYNKLGYDLRDRSLLPKFGARARHANYMEIGDIYYYDVPTPFTELVFKTTQEQGQMADAFITLNTHRRLNFSMGYKGLRSLGKYQHIRAESGNFRASSLYNTKNGKYYLKAHVALQNFENEENGGITDDAIAEFENGNEEFSDRSRFAVNFEDANNRFEGKRFYINHYYNILSKKDSVANYALSLGNITSLEDKKYVFEQTSANSYFGDSFSTSGQRDEVRLEQFYTQLFLGYGNKVIGDLKFGVSYTDYNYGYDRIVLLGSETIGNRLKNDLVGLEASYEKRISDKFKLSSSAGFNIIGDFDGNYIDAVAELKLLDDVMLNGALNINSKSPNFNFLLYQSDYKNYNWQNNFENVNKQTLSFGLESKKWFNGSISFSNIDNYTFFAEDASTSQTRPFQAESTINYLKLKLNKNIRVGKFGLDNTIMYQNVSQESEVFNVPEFITRNTLYFESHVFKKAMFLRAGLQFKYFTKYKMNAYNPLLAEFYVQDNGRELGGFPILDAFISAKIRSARIYVKAEHFNSSFTGYNFYSDPNNPYRDFLIRFGLEWNFFL